MTQNLANKKPTHIIRALILVCTIVCIAGAVLLRFSPKQQSCDQITAKALYLINIKDYKSTNRLSAYESRCGIQNSRKLSDTKRAKYDSKSIRFECTLAVSSLKLGNKQRAATHATDALFVYSKMNDKELRKIPNNETMQFLLANLILGNYYDNSLPNGGC
jgi:hypothetical protein